MELNNRLVDCSQLVCDILLELEKLVESSSTRLLELLRRMDNSAGKTIKVLLKKTEVEGVFVDYQSLNTVIVKSKGELVALDTASAILVDYLV